MEDLNISSLYESRNEWSMRLVNILTPRIIEGFKSLFEEAWKVCQETHETEKYIMTFQNLLSRVPKWNTAIIENERKRIIDRSQCSYLEDLITCVHVIQLKILTNIRVSPVSKKINVRIPKLDDFLHRIYIACSRKIYTNVYLFERGLPPLQVQKNNRELEIIVQQMILNTIRESMPIEQLIRSYMEESVQMEEEVVVEDIVEAPTPTPQTNEPISSQEYSSDIPYLASSSSGGGGGTNSNGGVKFNDKDFAIGSNGTREEIFAPKTDERLNEIAEKTAIQRRMEKMMESTSEEDDDRLKISDDDVAIDMNDFVEDIDIRGTSLEDDLRMEFEEV